jgi:hypothetical protein
MVTLTRAEFEANYAMMRADRLDDSYLAAERAVKIEREISMANQILTGSKPESIASRLERATKSLSEVASLASQIHYDLIGVSLPPDGPEPEEPGTLAAASRLADRLEEVGRWLATIKGFIAE